MIGPTALLAAATAAVWPRALHIVALAGFAVSMMLLIPAVASGRRRLFAAGVTMFSLAAAAAGAGFALRWAISGRPWYLPPIMNQFEAVAGSALLAVLAAIVVELHMRRGVVMLAAAFYASAAEMACLFLGGSAGGPAQPAHGILDSPLMAAHVATIILGHALAGMTLFISLTYLAVGAMQRFHGPLSSGADLCESCPESSLAVIDRCNLITAQLAAWMLAVGVILGAVWADVAWGRWWGWDIKETWALVTTAVFIAVTHIRYAVSPRTRGIVTAVGCSIGCGAMLFNWLAVNYLFKGLHSYAGPAS